MQTPIRYICLPGAQHGAPHFSAAPPPHNSGSSLSARKSSLKLLGAFSFVLRVDSEKNMWRHHSKRDIQADLHGAYGGRMLSGIVSLNYKDRELCTAYLIIRKLIHQRHALTICQTLIGRHTFGAEPLYPRTRPISQQNLPLTWLVSCHE